MRSASIILVCSAVASALHLPALMPKGSDNALSCMTSQDCHCDLSKVQQPPSSLPPPSQGLKLAMIAIGRGTQNYTCPSTYNASAVPTAIGALAKLYDFSCVASRTTADQLGNITAGFEMLNRNERILSSYPVTGMHFFVDSTTPTFAISNQLGTVRSKKLNATAAPASATNAVPWLKLQAVANQTSPIKEIYRLKTANGSAPATCAQNQGAFQVEYAAEYWYYVPTSFAW